MIRKSPPSSLSESSGEKRVKLSLPVEQLQQLNKEMADAVTFTTEQLARPQNHELALVQIYQNLTRLLARTDLESSVISPLSTAQAIDLVSTLTDQYVKHYVEMARKSILDDSWEDWLKDPTLQKPASESPPFTIALGPLVADIYSQDAIFRSWETDYKGNSPEHLIKYIEDVIASTEDYYANCTSVVQSSGMGKSRLLDEVAKKCLVIPVNLRRHDDSGFPAADSTVRHWFMKQCSKEEELRRAHAFLCALLSVTADCVQDIDKKINDLSPSVPSDQRPTTLALKFRLLMTYQQRYTSQGPFRVKFFNTVLEGADKLLANTPTQVSSPDISFIDDGPNHDRVEVDLAGSKLIELLTQTSHAQTDNGSLVVIAFDEAQILTDSQSDPDDPWSKLSQLWTALRALKKQPIFSVFISTTGKVQARCTVTPAAKNDLSRRVQTGTFFLPSPFTSLGFDQLAPPVQDKEFTLEYVSSIAFKVMLGRPLFGLRYQYGNEAVRDAIVLFAGFKLICKRFPRTKEDIEQLNAEQKLACMSVRLALEFNPLTPAGAARELGQVEKHMRVCLAVKPGFEYAVTVAPSEPIVVEAAFRIMNMAPEAFNVPRRLAVETGRLGLSLGDRGELLSLTVLLKARDLEAWETHSPVISVGAFMRRVVPKTVQEEILSAAPFALRVEKEDVKFKSSFRDSRLYFTHFVKVHSVEALSREFLWHAMVRGAAIFCADNQHGVDIIIPFLYKGKTVDSSCLSAIFIQSINSERFGDEASLELFSLMDPYRLGFFDPNEKDPPPVIRMVFACASEKSAVFAVPPPERQPSCGVESTTDDDFTAYDFWFAGAGHDTFGAILEQEESDYKSLLNRRGKVKDAYGSEGTVEYLARQMHPMAGEDSAHWTFAAVKEGSDDGMQEP